MYVTIKDILKMDKYKGVELIAGKSGLDRRVRNVYFMEVPDIYAYIEQNGLLLTTLYPISDKLNQIEEFIPKLAEMNIAGIAIKPGRYIDEIPEMMIKQANDYGIPLMKLPAGANLSTLTVHILTVLLDSRTELLEFRDKMHQQLLGLLLENAGIKRFVESFAELINAPVLLLNNNLEYIDSSIAKEAVTIHLNLNEKKLHSMNSHNLSVQVNNDLFEKNDYYIQSIYAGGNEFGYLVVLLEKEISITENLIVAVEQASFLVAILFQKEQALLKKERDHLSSFVSDIFNGQISSQTEITEKAKVFDWHFHSPILILSIKTNIRDSAEKISIYNRILDYNLIERIISEVLEVPMQNCKVLYHNDSLVCFVSILSENRLKQKTQRAGELILSNFKELSHLGISVADLVNNVNEVKENYINSLLIFKIYKEKLDNQSFVHFYEDIGLFRLFHYMTDTSVLQEFVDEKLGAVIEYDSKKEADLLKTLGYYIKNNTNIQKTSENMYVHYNTMRYRMNILKELGINYDDGFELMEIYLAYQLHLYLKMKQDQVK